MGKAIACAAAEACLTAPDPFPIFGRARRRAAARGFGRIGAVAQLGERRVRNAEVRGSIPLGSTKPEN